MWWAGVRRKVGRHLVSQERRSKRKMWAFKFRLRKSRLLVILRQVNSQDKPVAPNQSQRRNSNQGKKRKTQRSKPALATTRHKKWCCLWAHSHQLASTAGLSWHLTKNTPKHTQELRPATSRSKSTRLAKRNSKTKYCNSKSSKSMSEHSWSSTSSSKRQATSSIQHVIVTNKKRKSQLHHMQIFRKDLRPTRTACEIWKN